MNLPHVLHHNPFHVPPSAQNLPQQSLESNLLLIEPPIARDIFFSGRPSDLRDFLQDIRDTLRTFDDRFASDARRINWISRHFRSRDHRGVTVDSAAHSWFNGLLATNAHALGMWSEYADLKSFEYVIPELSSVAGFFDAMVNNFRDINSARVANDSLKGFKQGSMDLLEYNATFRTMAAHTSLSIDSQLDLYETNLSPAIFGAAIRFREWARSASLDDRMSLAVEAAAMASRYATLPADHPFSTRRSKYNIPTLPVSGQHHPTPIRVPVDPNAMQIDAITAAGEASPALRSAVRRVCWGKHLCFTCLGPKDSSHNQPNQPFCPNPPASPQALLDFLRLHNPSNIHAREQSNTAVSIAAVTTVPPVARSSQQSSQVTVEANWLSSLGQENAEEMNRMTAEHFAWEHDIQAMDSTIDVSTVRISPLPTFPGRFVVELRLVLGNSLVLVRALIDTGAMDSFIHKRVVQRFKLITDKLLVPLTCSGFDGTPGGELVTDAWNGVGRLTNGVDDSDDLDLGLKVNDIGNYDVILGLPWLDAHHAVVHCGTEGRGVEIGSLVVMCREQELCNSVCTTGPLAGLVESEELEQVKKFVPSQFHQYADVFLPQAGSLPPHRKHDVEINIKEGCERPTSRAYDLSASDEAELKAWVDDQLAKGFI